MKTQNLSVIKQILENQKEVKHLCYFVEMDERSGKIKMHLSVLDFEKTYKFRNEDTCLNKLVEILKDLKSKEKYNLKKPEKKRGKKF